MADKKVVAVIGNVCYDKGSFLCEVLPKLQELLPTHSDGGRAQGFCIVVEHGEPSVKWPVEDPMYSTCWRITHPSVPEGVRIVEASKEGDWPNSADYVVFCSLKIALENDIDKMKLALFPQCKVLANYVLQGDYYREQTDVPEFENMWKTLVTTHCGIGAATATPVLLPGQPDLLNAVLNPVSDGVL